MTKKLKGSLTSSLENIEKSKKGKSLSERIAIERKNLEKSIDKFESDINETVEEPTPKEIKSKNTKPLILWIISVTAAVTLFAFGYLSFKCVKCFNSAPELKLENNKLNETKIELIITTKEPAVIEVKSANNE